MTSCNEDPYDPACYCDPRYGDGRYSRIFEYGTGKYTCCGVVTYQGRFEPGDNNVCLAWATGTLDSNRYLAVNGYGPNSDLIALLPQQAALGAAFPLAVMDRFSVKCGRGMVPRYVSYKNLNSGSNYVATLACVPYDVITQQYRFEDTEPYSSGDFAFFLIEGCNCGNASIEANICFPSNPVGETSNISSLDFQSGNYRGPRFPPRGGNGDAPKTIGGIDWWLFWAIVIIFIILIVVIIGLMAWRTAGIQVIEITPLPAAPRG